MPAVRTTSTSTRRLDDFPSVLNWTGHRSISRERCSELEQEDGWNRDESIQTRSIHAQDGHVSLSVLDLSDGTSIREPWQIEIEADYDCGWNGRVFSVRVPRRGKVVCTAD